MAKSSKSDEKHQSKAKMTKKPVVGEVPLRQDGDASVTALGLAPAPLDDEINAYFAKCLDKIGFVPNVLTAYAHNLDKLKAFMGLYNDVMLAPSGLSKLEREMIAVVVSAVNRCFYCLAAHGAAVRQMSGDPMLGELLVMNWRAAKLSARHVAMLDFATRLTETPHAIGDAERAGLRQAGFSNADIWDIAATVGFFNMSNRVASATDMRPNDAYHAQAR